MWAVITVGRSLVAFCVRSQTIGRSKVVQLKITCGRLALQLRLSLRSLHGVHSSGCCWQQSVCVGRNSLSMCPCCIIKDLSSQSCEHNSSYCLVCSNIQGLSSYMGPKRLLSFWFSHSNCVVFFYIPVAKENVWPKRQ
jgi:hypothetical protein